MLSCILLSVEPVLASFGNAASVDLLTVKVSD